MKSYLSPYHLPPPHTPGLDSSELFGLPMTVPADFAMEYTCGPVGSFSGPRTFVRLLPLAPRLWTIEIGERSHPHSNDNVDSVHKVVQVSHTEVLDLYHEVIVQDFFDLRSTYTNPEVYAGGRSMLKVVANGDTKVVSVSNTTLTEFRDVVASLYDLAGVSA